MIADVWLFKEGLAIRLVAMAIWPRDAESQVRSLNASLSEQQKADGYEYRAVQRS